VITFTCQVPYNITVGTVTQLASARPINATTGVDNNGDGATNDRPVIDGKFIGKSAFRGTGTQDVALFIEHRVKLAGGRSVVLRAEGFNLFNHADMLARGITTPGAALVSIHLALPRLVAGSGDFSPAPGKNSARTRTAAHSGPVFRGYQAAPGGNDPAIKQRRGGTIVKLRILITMCATAAALTIAGSAFAQDKAAIDKGMKLYATKMCSACHSIAGKGNAKGPLDEVGTKLTTDQIRAWLVTAEDMTKKMKADRKPAMTTNKTLTKEDVDALVAYMSSLKKK
jgi:mono/diheme cytochrome c family protein